MVKYSIKMEIDSNPDYVSIIRLTTSGVANKIGFGIDVIEDLKVSVSEACTNAIKHSGDNKFTIELKELENGLEIEVNDNGKGYDYDAIEKPNLSEPKESGLGIFIIEALMDEVEIKSNENKGTKIIMRKYLGEEI